MQDYEIEDRLCVQLDDHLRSASIAIEKGHTMARVKTDENLARNRRIANSLRVIRKLEWLNDEYSQSERGPLNFHVEVLSGGFHIHVRKRVPFADVKAPRREECIIQ